LEVVVFQTVSRNGALTRMGASLANAFREHGVKAGLYLAKSNRSASDMASDLAMLRPKSVVSFASVYADLCDQGGESIYNNLGCAFIGWDVDHPTYNFPRFTASIAVRGQICASESHVAFASAVGCQATARLMLPGVDGVDAAPLPIAKRPIYGLAAMSWIGEPEVWWAEYKGTPAYRLIDGAIARLLADPEVNLLAAFQGAAADMAFELPLDDAFCQIIGRAGLFIRQYDRLRLAQALVSAGVPCAICGDGWRDRLGERANLLFADSLDFDQLAQLYGHSRVVFNTNGANGGSERATQAMARGATVASDFSAFLQTSFSPHAAISFYDRRGMSGVHEALALTADAQQTAADRCRELVAASHLWSHKAAAIMDMF
jgi:hypothetical protein